MLELITIDVTTYPPKGLGALKYKSHPRVGEWVEIEIEGIGTMFSVVMVAHSSQGAGSDIYIKCASKTSDAIKNLSAS